MVEVPERMQVAVTILDQIGGMNSIKAMIGGNTFVCDNDWLSFKWKQKSKNGANYLKITLNCMDTYDLEFQKIAQVKDKDFGIKLPKTVMKEEINGIYGDELKQTIEDYTGLYLPLY